MINGQVTKLESLSNRYRKGGVRVNQQELEQHLNNNENVIEIFM